MFGFLVSLLILDALLLSVVVLLQAGQGGGLASLGGGGGGTDTVLGGRQAVTILTKLTWWCGGIFLVLSLALSLTPRGGNSSALEEKLRAATPAAPSQAPLPLGPSTPETPTGQAPLPLGTPTQPAGKAPSGAAPAAPKPAPAPVHKPSTQPPKK
jgi:preprotein translocase subunit SecG